MNDIALFVDKKFSKIPRNYFCLFCFWVKERAVISEINKQRMCVISINFNLLHDRELGIKIFVHEFMNFFGGTIFLTEELIAWESQNLKALSSIFFMNFDHFGIIFRSKPSLASDINNHNKLFVSEGIETKLLSEDIIDFEVKEVLESRSCESL